MYLFWGGQQTDRKMVFFEQSGGQRSIYDKQIQFLCSHFQKKNMDLYKWLWKYIFLILFRLILIAFWKKDNEMVLAQLKNNSFSLHPPTAHESISFFFCTRRRRFVYGRRSNLINKTLLVSLGSYSHWDYAAVFPFVIFPLPQPLPSYETLPSFYYTVYVVS